MAGDYEVRDAEAEKALERIGAILRDITPSGMGFALLLFNFGAGGGLFYTSNAERENIIAVMQEFIAKQREN